MGGALVFSELDWAVPPKSGPFLQFEVVVITSCVMSTVMVQIKLLQNEIQGCTETEEAIVAKIWSLQPDTTSDALNRLKEYMRTYIKSQSAL